MRRIAITGCSGGGKSTLLDELARRGFAVCPEPGRQIVREELDSGGSALPWADGVAFAVRCAERAVEQYDAAPTDRVVFFDRTPLEQFAGLERVGLPVPDAMRDAVAHCRIDDPVFVAPPWPELFAGDNERRHGFDDALAEYEPLVAAYRARGHKIVLLPKIGVPERADFVERTLAMENSETPRTPFPDGLSQPALRALASAGYTHLEQLAAISDRQLLALHGMGPKGVRTLRAALATLGGTIAL